MTAAALSWHAWFTRRLVPAPLLLRGGRVGPENGDATSNSTVEHGPPADLMTSSPVDFFHGVSVHTRCTLTSDDVFFLLDVV